MMKKTKFRLIEGGIKPKEQCEKVFISSYITDTRLMGVMGLCIRWEVLDCKEYDELVQFFSFDTEEFGLENFENIWGYNKDRIFTIEHTTIGCLGGKKVSLTENEACYLVQHYHQYNIDHKLPLPKDCADYKFILDKDINLSDYDMRKLTGKFCKKLNSDYEAIHYCLMRIFGKDFEGAYYVTGDTVNLDELNIYPDLPMATFYKNSIEDKEHYYLCKSLVCAKNQYYLCTTRVSASDRKVHHLDGLSAYPISSREAAMILSRNEYIYFFESLVDITQLEGATLEVPFNTTCTMHQNGKLLMVFKNHNDHVDGPVFNLNDDIYGTYFITNTGQFIVTSASKENAIKLKHSLEDSQIGPHLHFENAYRFNESILYDFVGSDMDDFYDFLELNGLD